AAGELPQQVGPGAAAELFHPGPVVAGHGEHHVGPLHQFLGHQPGAVGGEVEAVLKRHEVRPFAGRRAIPRPGPGRRDGHPREPALLQLLAQQRLRQRAATGVAGADEQDVLHRSRSAIRRSSSVVILRLRAEPGSSRTGTPNCSTSRASSVADPPVMAARAWAASSTARGNPWGVWARYRLSRGTVRRTLGASPAGRSVSASFKVSPTGTAGTAPSPRRATAITAEMRTGSTKGRAASCTSTTSQAGGSAASPRATESLRSAPP